MSVAGPGCGGVQYLHLRVEVVGRPCALAVVLDMKILTARLEWGVPADAKEVLRVVGGCSGVWGAGA